MAESPIPPSQGPDSRILGPIPTPAAQKWKEVRLIYLPRTVFAVGVVVAAWLWASWVSPATLVAEAEIQQRDVRSAQAGVVASLKVDMLQPVHRGDVVGQIAAANPRLLDATLAVIRADVGMLSDSMAGVTDKQKMALEYEKLQLELMTRRVSLASLRGRLQVSAADLARSEQLYKQGLVTDQQIGQLKGAVDSLNAQIAEEARLVAHLEPIVRNYSPKDENNADLSAQSALAAAIKVQDAKLKLAEEQLTPQPLVAPIDGVVTALLRHPGEEVTAGETVLRITASRAERLVGFLRQPMPFEPKPGMTVEVRTRGVKRQFATTKITEVGAALEPIPPSIMAALRLPANPPPEHALRIQFALPTGIPLLPGEHVDVVAH